MLSCCTTPVLSIATYAVTANATLSSHVCQQDAMHLLFSLSDLPLFGLSVLVVGKRGVGSGGALHHGAAAAACETDMYCASLYLLVHNKVRLNISALIPKDKYRISMQLQMQTGLRSLLPRQSWGTDRQMKRWRILQKQGKWQKTRLLPTSVKHL